MCIRDRYIIRRRIRDKNGQMRGMEYTVLEQPQPPEQDEPSCAQPKQAEPKREKPVQENPAQLNTKEIKKEETNNVSNPIRAAGQRAEYRALLLKNIEYPILAQNNPMDTMRLDELVELMPVSYTHLTHLPLLLLPLAVPQSCEHRYSLWLNRWNVLMSLIFQ